MPVRVFVAAGEPSGDRHAAALLDRLETRLGPLEVAGLGGDALRARGARLLADVADLSVLGLSEVIRRLPFFVNLMRRCTRELESFRPDLVLPVDYPGFNLRLGRRARGLGIPVAYYIAPQVWAWKRERRPGVARAVDKLLVVFPFEEALFQEAGIDAVFVGHPLLDAPPPDAPGSEVRSSLGIGAREPLLALLPGSRVQEVRHILPPLLEGAEQLRSRGVRAVVSRASQVPETWFAGARARGIPVWEGRASALAAAADAALVASGTATLETGLTGTPLAVVYRVGALNWRFARRVVGLTTIGLVNIAAGGDRVPELLQDALTPEAIAATATRLLFDPGEREAQREYLSGLRARLGGRGAADRAAEEVAALLEARRVRAG